MLTSQVGPTDGQNIHSVNLSEKTTDRRIVVEIRGVPVKDFQKLSRRVDVLEGSLTSIVDKIDGVLDKLERLENAKSERRETVSKLLTCINEVWVPMVYIRCLW